MRSIAVSFHRRRGQAAAGVDMVRRLYPDLAPGNGAFRIGGQSQQPQLGQSGLTQLWLLRLTAYTKCSIPWSQIGIQTSNHIHASCCLAPTPMKTNSNATHAIPQLYSPHV